MLPKPPTTDWPSCPGGERQGEGGPNKKGSGLWGNEGKETRVVTKQCLKGKKEKIFPRCTGGV